PKFGFKQVTAKGNVKNRRCGQIGIENDYMAGLGEHDAKQDGVGFVFRKSYGMEAGSFPVLVKCDFDNAKFHCSFPPAVSVSAQCGKMQSPFSCMARLTRATGWGFTAQTLPNFGVW